MNEWIVPIKYGDLPEDHRPKARLMVMINEMGEVISTQWNKHSGDPSFDSSCIRAVQCASPFDTPSKKLKWKAHKEGFLIEFDPGLKS